MATERHTGDYTSEHFATLFVPATESGAGWWLYIDYERKVLDAGTVEWSVESIDARVWVNEKDVADKNPSRIKRDTASDFYCNLVADSPEFEAQVMTVCALHWVKHKRHVSPENRAFAKEPGPGPNGKPEISVKEVA